MDCDPLRERLIEAVREAISNELSGQEGVDLDLRRLDSIDRRASQVILAKVDRFANDLLEDEWRYLQCLEADGAQSESGDDIYEQRSDHPLTIRTLTEIAEREGWSLDAHLKFLDCADERERFVGCSCYNRLDDFGPLVLMLDIEDEGWGPLLRTEEAV